MRLFWLLAAAIPCALGQTCAPSRILPAGAISGSLDSASCRLSDNTPYIAYRLDLPTRGRIRIGLKAQDLQMILRDSTGAGIDSGTSIEQPIEAGPYTLLVNARSAGISAAYSVETGFTAETGTLCSAFPSLGVAQTVTGQLGGSG